MRGTGDCLRGWGEGERSDSELEGGVRAFLGFGLDFGGEGERDDEESLRGLVLGGVLARFLGGDSTERDLARFCCRTGDLDACLRLLVSSSEDGRRRRGGSRPEREDLVLEKTTEQPYLL